MVVFVRARITAICTKNKKSKLISQFRCGGVPGMKWACVLFIVVVSGIRIPVGQFVCTFPWYSNTCEAYCIFLRGIRVCICFYVVFAPGRHLLCIFAGYSYTCGAYCMYFYLVFAYLGGTLYAFLGDIRIPSGHPVSIFAWYLYACGAYCMGGHFVCIFPWHSYTVEGAEAADFKLKITSQVIPSFAPPPKTKKMQNGFTESMRRGPDCGWSFSWKAGV